MNYLCYIIYSKSIDHFYVGYTTNLSERLKLHNTGQFGGKSYTSRAKDWEIFLSFPCGTIEEAIYIESKIKKMKSRKYIRNLKEFPELLEKLRKDVED